MCYDLHVIYVKLEHVYIMCYMHIHPISIGICTRRKFGTCSTHNNRTCTTYKTHEMAILIVHIVICSWNLMINKYYMPHICDDPNIFGLCETILNLDIHL
jgi:hypothetical protein